MECRKCGACCIAISISSPIPLMPDGKPAGTRCVHLRIDDLCDLFGSPDRPAVCSSFPAAEDICGKSQEEAFRLIREMERLTKLS